MSSDSRGVGGHELAECTELLMLLPLIVSDDGQRLAVAPAQVFRNLLLVLFPASKSNAGPHAAIRCLLGLTSSTDRQPRAFRRGQAARAMQMSADTFQRSHEQKLLADAARDIWDAVQPWAVDNTS